MELFLKAKSQFTNERTGKHTGDLHMVSSWLRAGDEVTLVYDHHEPLRIYDGGFLHSSKFDLFHSSYGMMIHDEKGEYAICLPDAWTVKVPDNWSGRVARKEAS